MWNSLRLGSFTAQLNLPGSSSGSGSSSIRGRWSTYHAGCLVRLSPRILRPDIRWSHLNSPLRRVGISAVPHE